MQDGTLAEVLAHKATDGSKTVAEYQSYYEAGYQTDIAGIDIYSDYVSFLQDEEWQTAKYQYDGFEILTYDSGSKGVRYLFSKISGDEATPALLQFSDHLIEPADSGHYHLYMGNTSHEELLKEMDNWPTYYPQDYSGSAIAADMLHH